MMSAQTPPETGQDYSDTAIGHRFAEITAGLEAQHPSRSPDLPVPSVQAEQALHDLQEPAPTAPPASVRQPDIPTGRPAESISFEPSWFTKSRELTKTLRRNAAKAGAVALVGVVGAGIGLLRHDTSAELPPIHAEAGTIGDGYAESIRDRNKKVDFSQYDAISKKTLDIYRMEPGQTPREKVEAAAQNLLAGPAVIDDRVKDVLSPEMLALGRDLRSEHGEGLRIATLPDPDNFEENITDEGQEVTGVVELQTTSHDILGLREPTNIEHHGPFRATFNFINQGDDALMLTGATLEPLLPGQGSASSDH